MRPSTGGNLITTATHYTTIPSSTSSLTNRTCSWANIWIFYWSHKFRGFIRKVCFQISSKRIDDGWLVGGGEQVTARRFQRQILILGMRMPISLAKRECPFHFQSSNFSSPASFSLFSLPSSNVTDVELFVCLR